MSVLLVLARDDWRVSRWGGERAFCNQRTRWIDGRPVRPVLVLRSQWKWVLPKLMCSKCADTAGKSHVTPEIECAVETALHGIASVFTAPSPRPRRKRGGAR